MKTEIFKSTKFWYVLLFAILWLGVAGVSLIHAVSFFAVANVMWLAIILAIIFEIGQASVLFSILTSNTGKSKFMPWLLMCILTLVQIIGNVYSSYKYIMINSINDLKYFKDPIFIWTELPDNQATVIITYIVGGILPLVSLAMSAMITNYLTDEKNNKKQLILNNDTTINVDNVDKTIEEDDINEEQEFIQTSINNINEEREFIQTSINDINEETENNIKSHFINI